MTETETPDSEAELFECSFCRKSQKQVKKLIAGPEVFICDECVTLCNDIISEEGVEAPPTEEELGAAWAAMLKNRAQAAATAESALEKLVRQARAKGLEWSTIANFVGGTPEEAEERFGRNPPP